jgi:integrase/recombinase XerD
MSTTTISPVRRRMIEDMSLRNLAPRTQEAYIRGCKKLAAFLGRSPDTATAEDIRLFQLHLAEQGVSICTRNRTMTGVAFLFRVTLRRPEIADQIEYIAERRGSRSCSVPRKCGACSMPRLASSAACC